VSDTIDGDDLLAVIDGVENAIVADTNAKPVFGSGELFDAVGTRSFLHLVDMFFYRGSMWRGELEKVFLRLVLDYDGVGHALKLSALRLP
jgi:hypothetical protein